MDELCTVFTGTDISWRGPESALQTATARFEPDRIAASRVFFDCSGQSRSLAGLLAETPDTAPARRGVGRPKLGVQPREVTLLPRHWEWLNRQPGGASAALRRLVDEARRTSTADDEARRSRDAAHAFLTEMAGDLPGYEEVLRLLYGGNLTGFARAMTGWPGDIARYAIELATSGTPGDGCTADG